MRLSHKWQVLALKKYFLSAKDKFMNITKTIAIKTKRNKVKTTKTSTTTITATIATAISTSFLYWSRSEPTTGTQCVQNRRPYLNEAVTELSRWLSRIFFRQNSVSMISSFNYLVSIPDHPYLGLISRVLYLPSSLGSRWM